MADADRLFGVHIPTGSRFEALPVGAKYAILLTLTLPAFIVQRWWLTAACLAIAGLLLAIARVGIRRGWGITTGLGLLMVVLAGYQALIGAWLPGLVLAGNLLLAVWASRLVTMTTPVPDLIDALVRAASPLRLIGLSPDRLGLAAAIMLRSIPVIAGSFAATRQAAQARGITRHLGAQVTQVVVRAVGYAQATGAAMAARGIGDDD